MMVVTHLGPSGSEPEGVGAAVRAILGRLDDPEPAIRARAAEALGQVVMIWQGALGVLAIDRMAPALSAMADDPDRRIRLLGVRALGPIGRKMGPDPPPRLVAALDDPSEEIRTAAGRYLSTFRGGLARLLPTLGRAVAATRPECRPAYLAIVKEIRPKLPDLPPTEELIPALAEAAGSRDPAFRGQVLATLGEFRHEAREALPALIALLNEPAGAGPPAPPAKLILNVDGGVPRRSEAPSDPVVLVIAAIERVAGFSTKVVNQQSVPVPPDQGAVAALKPLLKSPDPLRRAAAIDALRSFQPEAALLPTLVEAADDRDPSIRASALATLGHYAQSLDFPPPVSFPRALDDDEPALRLVAAHALASFRSGVEPIVPALIRHALNDPVPEMRTRCEWALGGCHPPKVTPAVLPQYIAVIDNPEAPGWLRRGLIETLPRFGPPAGAAVPALIRVLRSPAGREDGPDAPYLDQLRRSAAEVLGRLSPAGLQAAEAIAALTLDLDREAPIEIAEALGHYGADARSAAPALLNALRRARERKSAAAAAVIADAIVRVAPGGPEEEKQLPLLIDYLDKVDKNSPSIDRVIAAVGRYGPRAAAALPRLRELATARAPQVQREAEKAVAAIEGLGRAGPA